MVKHGQLFLIPACPARSWPAQMGQGSELLPYLPVQGMACLDAVGTLLGLGANAHTLVRSAGNDTALHMAARAGRADVIQKLLDCGLNVQRRTKVGV